MGATGKDNAITPGHFPGPHAGAVAPTDPPAAERTNERLRSVPLTGGPGERGQRGAWSRGPVCGLHAASSWVLSPPHGQQRNRNDRLLPGPTVADTADLKDRHRSSNRAGDPRTAEGERAQDIFTTELTPMTRALQVECLETTRKPKKQRHGHRRRLTGTVSFQVPPCAGFWVVLVSANEHTSIHSRTDSTPVSCLFLTEPVTTSHQPLKDDVTGCHDTPLASLYLANSVHPGF